MRKLCENASKVTTWWQWKEAASEWDSGLVELLCPVSLFLFGKILAPANPMDLNVSL